MSAATVVAFVLGLAFLWLWFETRITETREKRASCRHGDWKEGSYAGARHRHCGFCGKQENWNGESWF